MKYLLQIIFIFPLIVFGQLSNDEIEKDGSWFVEIFNTEPQIRFDEFNELKALINLIEKRVVNK